MCAGEDKSNTLASLGNIMGCVQEEDKSNTLASLGNIMDCVQGRIRAIPLQA